MKISAGPLVCLVSLLVGPASWPADQPAPGDSTQGWRDFWLSVGVEPAPPNDLLDIAFKGRVDNFTEGRIPDATARQWVLADLRRSMGDLYASRNLREDIANAGVFGPPGLNGTTDLIQELREQGVERIDAPLMVDFLAAAVIHVSRDLQAQNPDAGLTDYVIVLLYRPKTASGVTLFCDGHREPMSGSATAELRWQIDTGHFTQHPVLGPIWFQERGWTCRPDSSAIGQLCGRVQP